LLRAMPTFAFLLLINRRRRFNKFLHFIEEGMGVTPL
jgi:hypothetical protein